MSFGQYTNNLSLAKQNSDLFNEVITLTSGRTLEYGIKVSFEIKQDPEIYCLDLLNKMELDKGEVNVSRDGSIYSIEFTNSGLKGYIENISYDNHNVVTISLVEKNSENRLSELEDKIYSVIERRGSEVESFRYLKVKIDDDDIRKVNGNINSFLKKQGAINIDTVNLENGYSTVAYTKRYTSIKNNGRLIDLNYAVCRYSSGSYLIIGTPVITINY
jgi:hypothetical protein